MSSPEAGNGALTASRRAPEDFALPADLRVSAIDASKIELATFYHPIAQIGTIAHPPRNCILSREGILRF